MTIIAAPQIEHQIDIAAGVDTHADTHTAAVIDTAGRPLGNRQFSADGAGYRALLAWVRAFGVLTVIGVEGTGAYGAGLARHLMDEHVSLVEIDRPDRKTRRAEGKSDPIDAEAAARAALGKIRTGVPKVRTGQVEALRNLRVARRSAVQQRADCIRRIKTLLITTPEAQRAQLRNLGDSALLKTCVAFRPATDRIGDPTQAAKIALRSLARRHAALSEEIDDLDALIKPLVEAINPALLELTGVGADVAAHRLATAGQNTERLHTEASFAMLCGVAPIPASSGKTHRHRLNRGGDRQANAAIYRIVLCRLRWDQRTQDYMARRTTEGLSKKDIIRCLKRLIAREIYYVLRSTETPHTQLVLAA